MGYTDKDKQREYQKAWIARRRFEYFKDKSCSWCGSIEELELDHIDPDEKLFSPATLWGMSDANPNKIAELAKCQVLCCECHKTKTIEQMPVTHGFIPYEHGTRNSYNRRNCRCGECRNWNIERVRKQRLIKCPTSRMLIQVF